MGLICPGCSNELRPIMIDDVEIDVCDKSCKSIWFDEGELFKIIHKEQEGLFDNIRNHFEEKCSDSNNENTGNCPHCDQHLQRLNLKMDNRVYLDFCNTCKGFWLDFTILKDVREIKEKLEHNPDRESLCAFFHDLYDPEGIFVEISVKNFAEFLCRMLESNK